MKYALLLLTLAACQTAPKPEQVAAADIGPPPSEAAVREQVLAYLGQTLLDPFTAMHGFGEPEKAYYSTWRWLWWGSYRFAWHVPVAVNARNAFGGYVGARHYSFWFLDDNLVAFGPPGYDWQRDPYEVGGGGLTAEQAGLVKANPENGN